jgi:hypothetical protein
MTAIIKGYMSGLREDSDDGRKALALTANTLIPLGIVATVFVALLGGMFTGKTWLDGKFESLRSEAASRFEVLQKQSIDLHNDVETIRRNVSGVERNRWTAQDAEVFALKLKLANPSITVPDVGEIVTRRSQNDGR